MDEWIQCFLDFQMPNKEKIHLYIVASGLDHRESREISRYEIEKRAADIGALSFEISNKTGIKEMMEIVTARYIYSLSWI